MQRVIQPSAFFAIRFTALITSSWFKLIKKSNTIILVIKIRPIQLLQVRKRLVLWNGRIDQLPN
jgi:hypothetical protein